jgi:hypothetical protein
MSSPTRGRLSFSETGPEYRGEYALDTPPSTPAIAMTWDQAAEDWVPAKVGGAGTIQPLSTVFYVDSGSTATAPDGSIAAPYLDVQDAIDERCTDPSTEVTLLLVPRSAAYGDIEVPASIPVVLRGLTGPAGARASIGDALLGDSASLILNDVSAGDITGPDGHANVYLAGAGLVLSIGGGIVGCIARGLARPSPSAPSLYIGSIDVETANLSNVDVADVEVSDSVWAEHTDILTSLTTTGTAGVETDLYSLQQMRAAGTTLTLAVGSTFSVIDAPTIVTAANVDDVTGAPFVTNLPITWTGCRPGDNFALAVMTNATGGTGIAFGAVRCVTNDAIEIPQIVLDGASTGSFTVVVSRLSVAGFGSTPS